MQRFGLSLISTVLVVLAYLVLITFSPSIHFIQSITFHDCQRLLQLVLLSFVLINAATYVVSPEKLIPINKNIRIGFYILLTLAIISSFNSIVPRQAIIEISIFSALCYLAIFVAKLYEEDKKVFIKRLTYALWVSILLYLVSFYVGYITAILFKKPLVWPNPLYGFSNVRLFQQYQLWGLGLICLPLLTLDMTNKTRVCLHFALTSWWVLLFYAASRGVVIGWFIAVIVCAVIYKRSAWPFLRIQLINAFTGLLAYQILFKLVPSLLAKSTETATIATSTIFRTMASDRINLWEAALTMIGNFPFFGVGPMQFYWHNKYGTHPHNSILQLTAEFGLPFTLSLLAIIVFGFYCWFKRFNIIQLQLKSKLDSNLSIVLFFTIIANGAYSLVEGVIVMPISQVLMFTSIGLMIGQYIEVDDYKINNQINNGKLRFRPIFAIVLFITMTFATFPEIKRGLTVNQRYLKQNETAFSLAPNTIVPRIWVQQRRIEKK